MLGITEISYIQMIVSGINAYKWSNVLGRSASSRFRQLFYVIITETDVSKVDINVSKQRSGYALALHTIIGKIPSWYFYKFRGKKLSCLE